MESSSGTDRGATANLTCASGYYKASKGDDPFTITCGSDALWTGSPLDCRGMCRVLGFQILALPIAVSMLSFDMRSIDM